VGGPFGAPPTAREAPFWPLTKGCCAYEVAKGNENAVIFCLNGVWMPRTSRDYRLLRMHLGLTIVIRDGKVHRYWGLGSGATR